MAFIPETPNPATYVGTDRSWEIRKRLITKNEARAAGSAALHLLRHAEQLSFIQAYPHTVKILRGMDIFLLGIGHPDLTDPEHTIYGNSRSRRYYAALIDVVEKAKAIFPETTDVDQVAIRALGPRIVVPQHNEELLHPARCVIGLTGSSLTTLVDPVEGPVSLEQLAGDAYAIRPNPETGRSIDHGVHIADESRTTLVVG